MWIWSKGCASQIGFFFWSFKFLEIESLCVSKTEIEFFRLTSKWREENSWLGQIVKCGTRTNSINITCGTSQKCKISGLTPDLLNLEFWERDPKICALSNCPGNSDAYYNLGTSGLKVSFIGCRGQHGIIELYVCTLLIKVIKSGKKCFVARRSWFEPYSITS